MATTAAWRYPDGMSPDEADGYDELRAEVARSSPALIRQRNALRKSEDAHKELIKRALKAGYAEGRAGFRADIQKISEFSVPTVRALAEEAGVPPDERYVKAAKVRKAREATPATVTAEAPVREPGPWAEPSPSMRPLSVPSEGELPADIRAIHPGVAADIVEKIRRGFPTWHDETRAMVSDAPPLFQNLLEIKRARDAGVLDDLGVALP